MHITTGVAGLLLATIAFAQEAADDPELHHPDLVACQAPTAAPADAIAACTRYIEHVGSFTGYAPAAMLLRANWHEKSGDLKTARAELDAVARQAERWPDAYQGLAAFLWRRGDLTGAVENYETALSFGAPADTRADLALLRLQMGDDRAAQALAAQVIKEDAKSWRALNLRAQTEFDLGAFGQAAADIERSLAVNPDQPYRLLWLHLARAYGGKDDTKELAANAAKADLDKWPGPILALYLGKIDDAHADAAAARGDSEKAKKDQACELNFHRAQMARLARRADEARTRLEQAKRECEDISYEHSAARAQLEGPAAIAAPASGAAALLAQAVASPELGADPRTESLIREIDSARVSVAEIDVSNGSVVSDNAVENLRDSYLDVDREAAGVAFSLKAPSDLKDADPKVVGAIRLRTVHRPEGARLRCVWASGLWREAAQRRGLSDCGAPHDLEGQQARIQTQEAMREVARALTNVQGHVEEFFVFCKRPPASSADWGRAFGEAKLDKQIGAVAARVKDGRLELSVKLGVDAIKDSRGEPIRLRLDQPPTSDEPLAKWQCLSSEGAWGQILQIGSEHLQCASDAQGEPPAYLPVATQTYAGGAIPFYCGDGESPALIGLDFKSDDRAYVLRVWVGRDEVTVRQFRTFVDASGYLSDAEQPEHPGCLTLDPTTGAIAVAREANWRHPGFDQADDHPVVCVTSNDANKYTSWLQERIRSSALGLIDLPHQTLLPHLYAPLPGADSEPTRYCQSANLADAGDESRDLRMKDRFECDDHYATTSPVDAFPPRLCGIRGLIGNVWEMLGEPDFTGEQYQQPVNDERGQTIYYKLVAGGGWTSGPEQLAIREGKLLAAIQDRAVPWSAMGFRIAAVRGGDLYDISAHANVSCVAEGAR